MTQPQHGLVIALDGPDGVGKSTQVELLVQYFTDQGRTVHKTRSSGGTPIGEALRQVSLADLPRPVMTDFYISLAMGEALGDDIQIRKANGEVTIIDRSPLAIAAYNGYGSAMPNKHLALEACKAMLKHWQIDVLFVFTADSRHLQQRRTARNIEDYFEKQDTAYHDRVQSGYRAGLDFLQDDVKLDAKIITINANNTIEYVHNQVIQALK